jgi:hypothetical protein
MASLRDYALQKELRQRSSKSSYRQLDGSQSLAGQSGEESSLVAVGIRTPTHRLTTPYTDRARRDQKEGQI